MKHYVVTRTTSWHFEAENWETAGGTADSSFMGSCESDQWEMVEVETGREEQLHG